MSEFFHMGGYAGYIWTSYGIAVIALSVLLLLTLRRLNQSRRDYAELQNIITARRPKRQRNRHKSS